MKTKYMLGEWELNFNEGRRATVEVKSQALARWIAKNHLALGITGWGKNI